MQLSRPSPDPASRPGRLGVGVVGAGRVGAVMGAALRAAGHAVVGVSAASGASAERAEVLLPGVPVLGVPDVVERAELVLLAVPDDALAPLVADLAAARAWQGGQLVVHTSGRYGTGVLAPVAAAGGVPLAVHPAMTFTGTSLDLRRLLDAVCAVTAAAPVLPVAQALVVEIGAEPVVVAEAARPLYHAALSLGGNHLVTLVAQAVEVLRAAGVDDPERLLGPLLRASLEGALGSGEQSLTGPVARGDVGTVTAHREALSSAVDGDLVSADVLEAYLCLARATAGRARAAGRLRAPVASALAGALEPGGGGGGARPPSTGA